MCSYTQIRLGEGRTRALRKCFLHEGGSRGAWSGWGARIALTLVHCLKTYTVERIPNFKLGDDIQHGGREKIAAEGS